MNIIKNLFFVCFILNFFVFCDDKQIFNKANEFYNKGSYEKSLELYNSIHKKSPYCWFNIGNCYYKLNKFPQAIGYWKRASKNAFIADIEDIEFNISKVKEKIENNYNSNLFGEFYNFFVKYLNLIPMLYVQIIFLIFWYLLFLFSVVKIKKKFYLVLSSIFLCNFVLLGCLGIKYNEQKNDIGMVIEKETMVYAGPNKNYHIIGSLNLAQEIKIKHKKNEWLKISNHELSGWILSDSILIL